MRFLFAPDSFKGSLSAVRICEILTASARARFPDAECISVPIADGGEGTIDALLSIVPGERISETVTGPSGDAISAEMARLSTGEYLIEMAQSTGLTKVKPALRNPLYLTSCGLGEMISSALDRGAERILVGLGGSATNDGGMGLLSALGAVFTSESGRILEGMGAELEMVRGIDLSRMHPGLSRARITVISDVNNPLLGENGATRVYAPQKGAGLADIEKLERGMTRYADAFFDLYGMDIASFPGAGAAGGCGAALCGVLYAEMRRGIDAILDFARFDELLQGASLVVTGEGRVDAQTARFGKAPAGIVQRCEKAGVPCAVVTGGMGPGAEELYALGNAMIFPVENAPMTLDCAIQSSETLLRQTADRLFWAFSAGIRQ